MDFMNRREESGKCSRKEIISIFEHKNASLKFIDVSKSKGCIDARKGVQSGPGNEKKCIF